MVYYTDIKGKGAMTREGFLAPLPFLRMSVHEETLVQTSDVLLAR